MGTRYRVLSLDGGGCWALIEAKALINIFGAETSGWDVLRQFDLAAANSGGSIVLGCLIENFTLGQVLDFFLDESKRRSVFAATSSIGDKILESLLKMGPKYSAEKKLTALQGILATQGNKVLGDAVKGLAGQRRLGRRPACADCGIRLRSLPRGVLSFQADERSSVRDRLSG